MGVLTLPVALTVSFVATTTWSGMRWSKLKTSTPVPSRLTAADELNHVVMGVAMVAMLWFPADFLGNVVQAVAFAIIAVLWLTRFGTAHSDASSIVHAAMNFAMTAMFVVMAAMTFGVEDSGGAHHGGGAEAAAAPLANSPIIDILNYTGAAAMAAAGLWWVWQFSKKSTDRGSMACHAVMCFAMTAMFLGTAH